MKIVINSCYGGFSLSKQAVKTLGLESPYDEINRNDPRLIKLVEEDAPVSGRNAKLEVFEIPDEATDWTMNEYDGWEEIIYVLNGKLYWS